MYICAYMSDSSIRRIKKIKVNSDIREIVISNVR